MPIAARNEPLIQDLSVTDRSIEVRLRDGRSLSIPLEWSWRLSEASAEERANFLISGDGAYVHWPDLDEDLSAQGMLTGTPAPRPKRSTDPSSSEKKVRVVRKRSGSRSRRRAAD